MRLDEEAIFAVGHDLAGGAHGRGNHGQPKAHRFEVDDAKAFVGGNGEQMVGAVLVHEFGVADTAEELDCALAAACGISACMSFV